VIRSTLSVVLLLLAATACEQKPKTEPTATPAVTPARASETTPVRVNPDEASLDQVPVQEDFEEQAAREVTADNLDTELDKLESEIAD
jgi:hypothetical protein